MTLDRGDGHEQLFGDRGVRHPARDRDGHALLAGGQQIELFCCFRAAIAGVGEAHDQLAGDRRRQDWFARNNFAQRCDEVGGWGVLEEEAAGAGLQRTQHQVVGVEGGQHDHLWRLGHRTQRDGGLEPVDLRHPDVHQHHVGAGLLCKRRDRGPVRGFADDVDVRLPRQHRPQTRTHQPLVVHEQQADGGWGLGAHRLPASHGRRAVSTKLRSTTP